MREEIAAAVVFITRLIRQNGSVSKEKVEEFSGCLSAILVEKFKNHWYLDHPEKGQGYRCIRINDFEPIDPVLEKAAYDSGLKYGDLHLPSELTLWVDPDDVCCRIGESRGSFCTLAAKKDGSLENRADTVNIEELLQEGKELHNQQVNIVTTRSNVSSASHHRNNFSKGLHYGANSNFYSKQQHNFYNNQQFQNTHNRFRPQNKNQNRRQPMVQEQVNGIRYSPEHVNEVRQKFMEQVTTAARGSEADKTGESNSENPKANTSSVQTSSLSPSSSSSSSSSDQSAVNTANDTATKSNNSDLNKSSSTSTSSHTGPKSQTNTSKSGTTSSSGPKSTQQRAKSNPHSNNNIKPGSYHGGKSQNNKGAYPHQSINQKLAQKVY